MVKVLGLRIEVKLLTVEALDVPTRLVQEFRANALKRCLEAYRPASTAAQVASEFDIFKHCDKLKEADQRRIVEEFFKCLTRLYIKA